MTKHARKVPKKVVKPSLVPTPPNSRPTSPTRQRDLIISSKSGHEARGSILSKFTIKVFGTQLRQALNLLISEKASERDCERFEKFMGMIKNSDLEPLEPSSFESIWRRSLYADGHPQLKDMLKSEIDDHYLTSVKHAIVDYILLDENEKDRLSIDHCPEFYQPMTIRSPVPWNSS